MSERKMGRVAWWNTSKGYGFINQEYSEDKIFVHRSAVNMAGLEALKDGQLISFVGEHRGGKAHAASLKLEDE